MAAVVWALGAFLLGVLVTGIAAALWWSDHENETQTTIAPEMLVDSIDDSLLLVGTDGTIQLTNTAFESQFGADAGGRHFEDVLGDYSDICEHVAEETSGLVTAETDGQKIHIDVSVYPVNGGERKLVFLRDVTAEHRQRQELEEQNERLDQFASLISHDLRNPLDVAIGRANALLRTTDDSDIEPHLESIEDALMRMHRIITQVLALARQGEYIGEKEEVGLDATARDAWSHVQTDTATLAVRDDQTVLADRDGLEHIFENLFRNAVEHASPDDGAGGDESGITVSVGTLPEEEGFYVADDGHGIPAEKRDDVLEAGYTDSEDGTGLGLAIVTSIANAHEWTVSVTESEAGGAQFEFSGVEFVPDEFVVQEQG